MTCTNCDCIKRQQEVIRGTPQHRCINQKSEFFTLPVVESQCAGCPVAVLLAARKKCGEPVAQAAKPADAISPPGYSVCTERQANGDEYVCGVTGLPVTPEICGRCNAEAYTETKGLGDKIMGYYSAIRRWVASGRPTRTDDEVKDIYENHCLKCERFDHDAQSCNACGCAIRLSGTPLTNKIKMGSEHCPIGRW